MAVTSATEGQRAHLISNFNNTLYLHRARKAYRGERRYFVSRPAENPFSESGDPTSRRRSGIFLHGYPRTFPRQRRLNICFRTRLFNLITYTRDDHKAQASNIEKSSQLFKFIKHHSERSSTTFSGNLFSPRPMRRDSIERKRQENATLSHQRVFRGSVEFNVFLTRRRHRRLQPTGPARVVVEEAKCKVKFSLKLRTVNGRATIINSINSLKRFSSPFENAPDIHNTKAYRVRRASFCIEN